MNQLSYYVTKRLIVGSKDSSGTIIQKEKKAGSEFRMVMRNELSLI